MKSFNLTNPAVQPWTAPSLTPHAAKLARRLARSRPVLQLDGIEATLLPAPMQPDGSALLLRMGGGLAQLTMPPALVHHLLAALDPAAPLATGALKSLLLELAVDPLLNVLTTGLPNVAVQLASRDEVWEGAQATVGLACRANGVPLGMCHLALDEAAGAAVAAALFGLPPRRTRLSSLPVLVRARVLAADLSLPELRGIVPGDVILAARQLPGRGILLVAGEKLAWRGSLVPGGIRAETGPLMLSASHGDWTMTPNDPQDRRQGPDDPAGNLDELPVRVVFELGRMELPLSELEAAGPGHVFELRRDEAQAVDIMANGLRVGAGEIVSIAGQLGVRVLWIGRRD